MSPVSLVREQEGEERPVPVVFRGSAPACGQEGTDGQGETLNK